MPRIYHNDKFGRTCEFTHIVNSKVELMLKQMASRFVPITDEKIFVPNEAAISPNTKKATNVCLTVHRGIL